MMPEKINTLLGKHCRSLLLALGPLSHSCPWHPPKPGTSSLLTHSDHLELDCGTHVRGDHRVHHSGRGRYHTAGRLETRRARVTEPDLSSRFGCGLRCASGRRLRAIPSPLAAGQNTRHAWSRGCLGAVWRFHNYRRVHVHARRQDPVLLSIWDIHVLYDSTFNSVRSFPFPNSPRSYRTRGRYRLFQAFFEVLQKQTE